MYAVCVSGCCQTESNSSYLLCTESKYLYIALKSRCIMGYVQNSLLQIIFP